MTCTHTASTKGDYEDPYKPAARSSLELTIMPAVGASSAFSIVSSHSVNGTSAHWLGRSRPAACRSSAHHGTLDSLLAEAQILLYLLLALQCIQELVLGLGNIRATYMRGQACETDGSREGDLRPRLRACLRRVLRPNTNGALTVASTLYLECAYDVLTLRLPCAY